MLSGTKFCAKSGYVPAEAKTKSEESTGYEKGLRRNPVPIMIYVSKEMRERIVNAAKIVGSTISSVVREGVLAKVLDIEEGDRLSRLAREERDSQNFVPRNKRSSRGLGLKENNVDLNPLPPPAPTIIVNPPTASTASASSPAEASVNLDRLVAFVIGKGSIDGPFERERRMKKVKESLEITCVSEEEARKVLTAIEEKISSLTSDKKSSWFSR